MIAKIYLVLMVIPFFSPDLSKCSKENRITVTGIALYMKRDAYVQADDGIRYFLDETYDWGDKYYEKRVKVTGKLVIVDYPLDRKITNDSITAIPQRRLGTWRIIKKPKWSLVE